MAGSATSTAEIYNISAIAAGAIPSVGGTFYSGINHDKAADWILNNYSLIYIIETGRLFVYDDGVYREHGEVVIKQALANIFNGIRRPSGKALLTGNDVKEIIEKVKPICAQPISIFDTAKPLLNLENGVLNLETFELLPHSPDYYFLNKLPVKFDTNAKCPMFMNFCYEVLESKFHPVIDELIGYMLWPDYRIHKAFMFLGEKRTGKSTMVNVFNRLVGDFNCSHVQLQELAENRFKCANLFGKMLNTYSDLPKTVVIDVGVFKSLTGADYLEGERKFESAFNFMNRAKLVFSTNYLPMLKEPDDAYYGRWIIIPFNKSFYGKEDTTLLDRLTTPEELSGILNLGLYGLKKLRENNWKFSYTLDAAKIYQRASNPLIAFLEDECLEMAPGEHETKQDLMKAYNAYAKEHKLQHYPTSQAFGRAMKEQTIIPVSECRPIIKDEMGKERQVEAWSGILLKSRILED